ncbi:MAG: M20/M25/M40 family metallo-hydrolase [Candidatus Latescibacterota bacterium]|nr:MAG: M20/M25/M40 family metallo-hydrolase [Candidatus Latescibacterota bacterium]
MNAKTVLGVTFLLLALAAMVVGLFVDDERMEQRAVGWKQKNLTNVLETISTDSISSTIRTLTQHRTRRFTSPGAAAAVQFVTAKLRGFGLPVEHHYVNVRDRDDNAVVVTNVLCELGPSDPDRGTLIMCAHYDSRVEDRLESAPGADDNASGVAVLLETARVLVSAGIEPGVTLVFFGGEEDDLIGSRAYARSVLDEHQPLRGVINVDMVGYDEHGPHDIVIFTNPSSVPLALDVARVAESFANLKADTTITNWGNSDHASFWEYGQQAISIWEGYDHNPYHYTAEDKLETISLRFLSKITRLVVAASVWLADTPRNPTGGKTEYGAARAKGLTVRYIGDEFVDDLPQIDGNVLIVTREGRVVARLSASRGKLARRDVRTYLGDSPGVYLVSRVSVEGAIPTEAIEIK